MYDKRDKGMNVKTTQPITRGIIVFVLVLLTSCNSPTPTEAILPTPTLTPIIIPTNMPTPYPPPDHRIGIRVNDGIGEFFDRATNEKFIPRGMNYVHLGTQTDPSGGSAVYHIVFDPDKYDTQKIDAALKQMHEGGYNVVRVFLSPNTIGTADGLSEPYMENVSDFLTRAKQNQIHVMFTLDGFPGGKYDSIIERDCCTNFNSMNLNYLSPAGLEANVTFFQDFIQSLLNLRAPTDIIFSYELRNEMFYETDQPPLSLARGKITAANGKTYDMASTQDKEKMVEENLVYWIDTVRSAILEKDPTALVSVGFLHPQTPNAARVGDPRLAVTEPAIWNSQVDFIDLHVHPGFELDLSQYVENFGIKNMQTKPIIMGEFGGTVKSFVSTDIAARRLVNWQAESCKFGFDGWLFWTWDDDEEPDFFNALMDNGKLEKVLSPLYRPDACSVTTSLNSPTNLSLSATVIASHALPGQLAMDAIDGTPETQWDSGHAPTQWIEIDLGKPHTISSFRLTVAQSSSGATIHQVWVRSANGNMNLIHEFNGDTVDGQVLEFVPDFLIANIQVVRIVTTQSPSDVSWKEIEISGQ